MAIDWAAEIRQTQAKLDNEPLHLGILPNNPHRDRLAAKIAYLQAGQAREGHPAAVHREHLDQLLATRRTSRKTDPLVDELAAIVYAMLADRLAEADARVAAAYNAWQALEDRQRSEDEKRAAAARPAPSSLPPNWRPPTVAELAQVKARRS